MGEKTNEQPDEVTLHPVTRENWRAVCDLTVSPEQREFVADPGYYLSLCNYEDIWHPLAVHAGEQVVGMLMWGVDPADGSYWLGGVMIDAGHQGKGYGRKAVQSAVEWLAREYGASEFALSYLPSNQVAKGLYYALGFRETGEWEGDEVVARRKLS